MKKSTYTTQKAKETRKGQVYSFIKISIWAGDVA